MSQPSRFGRFNARLAEMAKNLQKRDKERSENYAKRAVPLTPSSLPSSNSPSPSPSGSDPGYASPMEQLQEPPRRSAESRAAELAMWDAVAQPGGKRRKTKKGSKKTKKAKKHSRRRKLHR